MINDLFHFCSNEIALKLNARGVPDARKIDGEQNSSKGREGRIRFLIVAFSESKAINIMTVID